MKKPDLESILKRAELPEISEESLALFPRRIVARLKNDGPPPRTAPNCLPRLTWAFGLATGIVIAVAIGHWRGRMPVDPAGESLASLKLIRETLALFPNQVRAIVQDEHGMNLVLSDHEDVPDSAPLYVRICDGRHCTSLVTFSGQEIQVAGQTVTVLADAHGGIILSGRQFVWSSTEPIHESRHLEFQAKMLGAI